MSQSLERGLQTLLFLATRKSIGVTELATELNVNKSTAYRILETLRKYNMTEQKKVSSKYKLGPAVLQLSEQVYKDLNIISIAKPYMQKLVEELGESTHLCILSNNSAVVIEQITTSSRLSVNSKIGNNEPLHASSVGKCLLAFVNSEELKKILNKIKMDKFNQRTIVDKETLIKELTKTKKRGYAIDDREITDEIRCISVPIFNHKGQAVYSLGLSGPVSRMTRNKMEKAILLLKKTGESVSAKLGHIKEKRAE